MNPELLKSLDEILVTAKKLLQLMEEDQHNMRACINGDILEEYHRVSEETIQTVKNMQNTLIVLHDKQTLGL